MRQSDAGSAARRRDCLYPDNFEHGLRDVVQLLNQNDMEIAAAATQ